MPKISHKQPKEQKECYGKPPFITLEGLKATREMNDTTKAILKAKHAKA